MRAPVAQRRVAVRVAVRLAARGVRPVDMPMVVVDRAVLVLEGRMLVVVLVVVLGALGHVETPAEGAAPPAQAPRPRLIVPATRPLTIATVTGST